ncbi:enoyl-CoA hydratase-related protein [Sphingosinicella rhizophila]|uniref:Enoyl-CoA hydratase-related protein n=1 Tax=Sphingosinicella rhizophila TaxID=3050082 RepID=A0ABU3Q485_9SPHN|nr:enoyl-CoA hydratase-related protein [Sphingosinicella sp. GR2756]MDT9598214.1 enoyl-CoA hydratase-related protein [Sphingosinicella sp. GR2756]
MTYETIRMVQSDAAVATITMARPEALNALSLLMLDELRAALRDAVEAGARSILLTGEGRGFSSGADLGGGGLPEDVGAALEEHYNPLVETLFNLPIPVVAAVNGPAAGAGCSLALAADFVIAGRSAYFLQAFVNIGLIPDAGATWLLPRLAGRARAMEMMMLGERISAEQALQWGLIARLVEDEYLTSESVALATRLAQGPTIALGLIRKLARDADHLSLSDALRAERAAQCEAGHSQDFKSAVMSFISKQQPRFDGR